MWSYLSKSLRVDKVIQTLNTMMAAGDEGRRGIQSYCLMGVELVFCKMKKKTLIKMDSSDFSMT